MEPFFHNSGFMNVPMAAHRTASYSHQLQSESPGSSMALNRPLCTRAQAMENLDDWGRGFTSLRAPGSYPRDNLPLFNWRIWQEAGIPIRPIRIQSLLSHTEPYMTVDQQPHNLDPPTEISTPVNFAREPPSRAVSQEYQFSSTLELQATGQNDNDDAPVTTDAEARGQIGEHEYGRVDGHDDFRQPANMNNCYVSDDAQFLTHEATRTHNRSHQEEARHKCKYCGCGFKTLYSRRRHLYVGNCAVYSALQMQKTMPNSAVECPGGNALLQQHEYNHGGAPIITNVRSLAKPPIGSFIQCPHCTKQLSCERRFRVHLRVHNTNKPYSCNECQVQFASVQGLGSHSRSRGCKARKASNEQNSANSIQPEQYKQNLEPTNAGTFDLSGDSDGDLLHMRNDQNYSISQSSGSKLWEKVRKSIKIIINTPPSHHYSRYRAFFADDKFAAQGCGLADTADKNGKSTPDIENGDDCAKDSEVFSINSEPSPLPSLQRPQTQFNSLVDLAGVKLTNQSSLLRSDSRSDSLPGSLQGLGMFQCPLCETRFRRTGTVRRHLIAYHHVRTANQKALGFNRPSTSYGNSMAHLQALPDNVNELIGRIFKTAEGHRSIRAKFRRLGRGNTFEVDMDP